MKRSYLPVPLAALMALCCLAGCRRRPAEEQFKYDLGKLKETDPSLLLYEEAPRMPLTLAAPVALAVDGADRIYVCGSNTIHVLSPVGRKLHEFAVPAPARCLAVGEDGSIFVGVGDHVVVLNTNGSMRVQWPAYDANSYVTALVSVDDDVFVADAGNRLVLCYRRNGKLQAEITGKKDPSDAKGFIVPSPSFDIAPGHGGGLWVTNPGRRSVQNHTIDGVLLTQWGHASMQVDGFCGCCNPARLDALPGGGFITAEKGLVRVKVYSPAGEFVGVVAGPEAFAANAQILDIAADSGGRILVLDSQTPAVRLFVRKKL